jgi:hypothetical protein
MGGGGKLKSICKVNWDHTKMQNTAATIFPLSPEAATIFPLPPAATIFPLPPAATIFPLSPEDLCNRFHVQLRRHATPLRNLLTTHNAVISGSFVLKLICNTDFQDIDVFVEEKNLCPELIDSFWQDEPSTQVKTYAGVTEIDHIYNSYLHGCCSIQLIVCKNDPRTHIIPFQFDLDILKNYYDGHHVWCYCPNDIESLRTTYYFSFGSTESEICQRHLMKKVLRIVKYLERGISIQLISFKHKDIMYEILEFMKNARNITEHEMEQHFIMGYHEQQSMKDPTVVNLFEKMLENSYDFNVIK